MEKRMICLTLALSMMIGSLTTRSSIDSSTTGASAAPASSTVSTAKEADFQDIAWPERPVQIIVGTNAGGSIDAAVRPIGKYMEKYMGQSLIVTNTTGGAGGVTADDIRNAKMDGYIFLIAHKAILINKTTGTADFDYNAFACTGIPFQVYITYLLNKRYASVLKLADAAKTGPGAIRSGTELATNDTTIIAMMEDDFSVFFQLVDAGAASNQVASMIGDHIGFMKAPVGFTKDYVASGNFHILAFFNQKHSPNYPDMPIMKGEGVDFVVNELLGCLFSEGTDPAIIEKFFSVLEQICRGPGFQKEAADVMYGVDYTAPADVPAYFENYKTRLAEYQDLLEEHYSK